VTTPPALHALTQLATQLAEPAALKLLVRHALDPHPILLPFEIPLVLFAVGRRAILARTRGR
jgi:hypothetical protein